MIGMRFDASGSFPLRRLSCLVWEFLQKKCEMGIHGERILDRIHVPPRDAGSGHLGKSLDQDILHGENFHGGSRSVQDMHRLLKGSVIRVGC